MMTTYKILLIFQVLYFDISPEKNLIDAASSGASQSIKLVANIAVNLIAFISLLALVNDTLTWFGKRAGVDDPPLTFEVRLTVAS